jgi:short-subunit dehydrogenase
MNLKDKIAIVTGAASGIGKETSIELAKRGCTPVLVDINEAKLGETLIAVLNHAPDATAELCDISNDVQIKQLVQKANERYGRMDILINNAGIMIVKLFDEISQDEFDRQMAVNFYGGVNLIRTVLPIMKKQGRGVIINVASVGGRLVVPGTAVYAASKAAFQGFSESLYFELKDRGIHVGIILPGGTRTGIFDASTTKLGKYYQSQSKTAPTIAAKAIRQAIEKERFVTITPSSYKLLIEAHDFFPGLFSKQLLSRLRPYFK